MTLIEPPDGTRLEFALWTDLYAAYRDDKGSREAGWREGCHWCLYGFTIPMTWSQLVEKFGETALAEATLLVPSSLPALKKD